MWGVQKGNPTCQQAAYLLVRGMPETFYRDHRDHLSCHQNDLAELDGRHLLCDDRAEGNQCAAALQGTRSGLLHCLVHDAPDPGRIRQSRHKTLPDCRNGRSLCGGKGEEQAPGESIISPSPCLCPDHCPYDLACGVLPPHGYAQRVPSSTCAGTGWGSCRSHFYGRERLD